MASWFRARAIAALALAVLFCSRCSATSTSIDAPTSPKCAVSVNGTSASTFPASGGQGSLAVTTARDCTWSVSPEASWVSVATTAGQGPATVSFTVASNPTPSTRTSAIDVSAERVSVSQAGAQCRFDLSKTHDSIGPSGGQLTVGVTTLAGCAWTASSAASWISIVSGRSGNASGMVALAAAPNTGPQRSGQVTIGGVAYTITQDAAPTASPPQPSCSASLSSTSKSVGANGGTVDLDVSAKVDCAWTAVSNASWIAVSSGASGSGNGHVRLQVAPNTLASARSGTVDIAGLMFTVTEDGTAAPAQVDLSGSISGESGHCPDVTFDIGASKVTTDAATRYVGGSCSDVRNKQKVTVSGTTTPDGPVHAIVISFQG